MSFEYRASDHSYWLDDAKIPSVTTVLGLLHNFDSIPWATLERARQRGEQVHLAINAFNRGRAYALDDEYMPYLRAWERFIEDTNAVVIQSEQPVVHGKLRYAGTPDCVLSWRKDRSLLLPDVKASFAVPPTVGAQTAAYAEAFKSQHSPRQKVERACVHVHRDGTYKLHMRDDSADWSLFISTLNVYRFLEKHQ